MYGAVRWCRHEFDLTIHRLMSDYEVTLVNDNSTSNALGLSEWLAQEADTDLFSQCMRCTLSQCIVLMAQMLTHPQARILRSIQRPRGKLVAPTLLSSCS